MTSPRKPRISTRKEPKQTRSRQLVSDILIAAGRVLAREGAHRFTAARVAEEAGVSVGSLYQYFPNKEAILFRLQSEEWERTSGLLTNILSDKSVAPFERLRSVVLEFVRSECEEADMRNALDDAAPLYRDAPESQEIHKAGTRSARAFIEEILPHVAEPERILVADITMMSLKAVGKQISEAGFVPDEVDLRARALGDMFCAYLQSFMNQ
ncbi:MAG: TetR family transcriptional regulator [Candidatus Obscuribacterales bacterium]|nr:TetR family transcriptional regulator [Candidatus Obscuribacterales bacterium]